VWLKIDFLTYATRQTAHCFEKSKYQAAQQPATKPAKPFS
jgi:hypothetical protein